MSGRSDIDVAALRARLEAEQAELRDASAAVADHRKPVELDQQTVGRLSRMDALQVQAMAKAQEERRQARLVSIDAALKRVDDGTYGECLKCGDDIPAKRLDIDPATARCVGCMEGG